MDTDIRRLIGSFIALGILMLVLFLVVLAGALNTKAIRDHRIKESLKASGVVVVVVDDTVKK